MVKSREHNVDEEPQPVKLGSPQFFMVSAANEAGIITMPITADTWQEAFLAVLLQCSTKHKAEDLLTGLEMVDSFPTLSHLQAHLEKNNAGTFFTIGVLRPSVLSVEHGYSESEDNGPVSNFRVNTIAEYIPLEPNVHYVA